MAYSKYVTQFKDKDNNIYGVMDEECRLSKADIIAVSDTTPSPVKTLTDGSDGLPMGVTVGIEPVQDLHGQDAPYPAGGGRNKYITDATSAHRGLTFSIVKGELTISGTYSGNASMAAIISDSTTANYQSGMVLKNDMVLQPGTYTISVTKLSGSYPATLFNCLIGSTLGAAYNETEYNLALLSGAKTVTLDTEMYACFYVVGTMEAQAYSAVYGIQIESGSTAHPYAPYSNICPISGWSAVKVSRTGKNLFDSIITFTNGKGLAEDGYTEGQSANWRHTNEFLPVDSLTEYTLQLNKTNTAYAGIGIRTYDSSYGFINSPTGFSSTSDTGIISISFTTPENARYVRFNIPKVSEKFQLEEGSEATVYEQFGQNYGIAIPSTPGTVYGGSLTVNKDGTGKLVVNKSKWTVPRSISSSYLTYSSARGVGVRYTGTTHMKKGSDNSRALCNFTDICMPYNTVYMSTQNWTFFKGSWTSTSEFMEVIEEMYQNEITPEFVWLLDSANEYTLTASEVNALITSLKGVNNIFADSGDVLGVEYSADTKLYVDGKISEGMKLIALLLTANHENGMKASKAYESGDLLTVGNTLYKATTSIANGATLTEGTNVTETTIAQELAALA